jgi:hypothetical protein
VHIALGYTKFSNVVNFINIYVIEHKFKERRKDYLFSRGKTVCIARGDDSLPFCLLRQTVLLIQYRLPTEIYIMTVNFSSKVIT